MSILTEAFNRLGGYDSLAERFPGGLSPRDGAGSGAACSPATPCAWRHAFRLTCGDPAAGSITVWRPFWDAAGPLWQAAQAAGPPPLPASTESPAT